MPEPQIFEGHGTRSLLGQICKENGYNNVLLVTDKKLKSLGFDEKILKSLDDFNIKHTVFDEICSEPSVGIIDAGRKVAIECSADCVIALGGGSVLDTSKMIVAGMKLPHINTNTLLLKFLFVPGKTIPMISIPSTAGTGAEVTIGAVVTHKNGTKGSTVIVGLNVTHVVLDSELTIHAPKNVSAACGIDALSHCVEGTVSDVDTDEAQDNYSLEGVKLIFQNLPKVLENPNNQEARLAMCRAALYGGYAINNQLAGYVHAFAHSIGAKYHIPHGQAISLMILPVLEYQKAACLKKYAEIARYCNFSDKNTDDNTAANNLLHAISDLLHFCELDNINLPVRKEDYAELTKLIAADSVNYSAIMTFSNADIENVLRKVTSNL